MDFSPSSSSFDTEVPSCSNACSKAYVQLHSQYDKLTNDFRKSQFDVISYQAVIESVEARLLVYKQNESVFEENIKVLNIEVQLRDTALVTLRKKLEKAEQERVDLKLKLEKFQTSSKNLTELLASQTNEKHDLGYNSHVFPRAMLGSDDYFSSKSYYEIVPPSSLYDRLQPSGSPSKPAQDLSHTNSPTAPIIEDWVFNFEDESETKAPQIVPSFVQSSEQVKTPRHSVQPEEPKRVHQAIKDPSWIEAMQEELLQFKMNKKDKRGIVVKNKARLVAQGHTQEEGIDYKEVFSPVARIEAIRLFLAYASFMGFMVYQMNVKSAFLYITIEEEVYVCQPSGFEDPDHPDKVYKVIYVDDIIFGATNKDLCKSFEKLMKDKFQMSSMGELTFFLEGKSASTHIDSEKPLLKDPDGEDLDVHTYRSMIGSLMYLTSSRPNIMFVVCACACFQVTPKASHLHAVKRIFRYLKGKPHLGLWYPKDSPFDLVAYSDSDYAGASLDRKSTTGGCQFLGCRLI
nr:hypothetical protein [Tanacetum cinerariifolium]